MSYVVFFTYLILRCPIENQKRMNSWAWNCVWDNEGCYEMAWNGEMNIDRMGRCDEEGPAVEMD